MSPGAKSSAIASVPNGHASPSAASSPYDTTSTPRGPSASGSTPTNAPNRQLPECAWLKRNFWLVAVASRRTSTSERTAPARISSKETDWASQPFDDVAPGEESLSGGEPPSPTLPFVLGAPLVSSAGDDVPDED